MSGGILIQDVTGHHNTHLMTTKEGKTFPTSSIHHQMMYPWKIPHELLAWTHYPKSMHYLGITDQELDEWQTDDYGHPPRLLPIEPEVVWFPETKCLAIQGHPEMMDYDCQFNQYIGELVKEKCG